MYSENDLTMIKNQLKKRRLGIWIPCAALLSFIVLNAIFIKKEWLTYLIFIIAGCFTVFGLDFIVMPVKKYARYLNNALHGRTRTLNCIYKSTDADVDVKEGIRCRAVTVSEGDVKNEKDDRLLYLDVLAAEPDWQEGDKLNLTTHDKYIVDWKKAE